MKKYDYVIIGGGFYGCNLALFLRSISSSILLIEAGEELMTRASRVNQARIHTGFHYPRSAVTAVKSMVLHEKFAADYPEAVVSNFQMLYGISRRRSRVNANRFFRTFKSMGSPIEVANTSQSALFDDSMIEAVFNCTEYAFDYRALHRSLADRLDAIGLEVRLGTEVTELEDRSEDVIVRLASGEEIEASHVFNVTYSQINHVLRAGKLPQALLKHELVEIALIEPPAQLEGYAVTIMDGPFMSTMPYPAEGLYSLTHVRYTPQMSWTDADTSRSPYEVLASAVPETRHRHMILDSQRYVPCLADAAWVKSIYDVKTVLLKNEADDGRPILYQRQPRDSRVISIMGGKIDNIYDLFELIRTTHPEWSLADDSYLFS
ncbi:MAG: FAD-binding oxidoreductase [Alphaproteobacteria bacterium]|nr:FAD-binding oxidoreductase [Alphaproteobacteria bacterium]